MKNKKTAILADLVERQFLPFVRTPSRYIGGEINQIRKNLDKCDLKIALCFPDIYEIGMSHTGLAISFGITEKIFIIHEIPAAERLKRMFNKDMIFNDNIFYRISFNVVQ